MDTEKKGAPVAHEVLRTLWAESTFFVSGAEKAQEEATSQLEMNNMEKVAWSQKSWGGEPGAGQAASVTEVLQPRTNRKVAPAKA